MSWSAATRASTTSWPTNRETPSSRSIRLAEIELMPAWRGRGIGSSIVRWLMKEAAAAGKPLTLRVLHVNERARDLYERLGFRPFKEIETHVYLRWDSASGTYPP
jgi:ribosomal protein S18 acetylase RimI-like enzyme